jgi:hypothetical protein
MSEEKNESGPPIALSKKVYATPTVREYGAVSKLTRGGLPSINSDNGNNMMSPTRPCL